LLFAPEEPGTETVRVPVLRVFDGDGFLTRVPVSLYGSETEATVRFGFIDAPEMEQPGGREAKDFLSSLIDGRWLDLVLLMKMDTGRIVDAHGRIVGVPYLRSTAGAGGHACRNVELEMVLNGWAWVLDRYCPEEHYFDALADARRHRRGIWAFDENVHPWEFKKQAYRLKRELARTAPLQRTLFSADQASHPCPQDGCPGYLVQRSGKFGTFFGCSEFPNCRYSVRHLYDPLISVRTPTPPQHPS
jgi:endonuclease YncB( thermonuclease family)